MSIISGLIIATSLVKKLLAIIPRDTSVKCQAVFFEAIKLQLSRKFHWGIYDPLRE